MKNNFLVASSQTYKLNIKVFKLAAQDDNDEFKKFIMVRLCVV